MLRLFRYLFCNLWPQFPLNQVVTAHSAHPLDLEIRGGAFSVLVGPKGSGASNILRAIAGLEKSGPAKSRSATGA